MDKTPPLLMYVRKVVWSIEVNHLRLNRKDFLFTDMRRKVCNVWSHALEFGLLIGMR